MGAGKIGLFIISIVISVIYFFARVWSDYQNETIKNKAWLKVGLPVNLVISAHLYIGLQHFVENGLALNSLVFLITSVGSAVFFHIFASRNKGPVKVAVLVIAISITVSGASIVGAIKWSTPPLETNESRELTEIYEALENSIQNMSVSFEKVTSTVKQERDTIRSINSQLIDLLSKQKKALESMSNQKLLLKEELSYYQKLKNLDSKEVKAINKALKTQTWFELILQLGVGFVLGFFTNIASDYFKGHYLNRAKKPK